MIKNNKKILVVDDSEIDRNIIKDTLNEDFDVVEADNGYTALEIIIEEGEKISAVILDVSMRELGGFEVLDLMNENHLDFIPVFLITVEATKSNVERASQYYNVAEFIKKPFNRTEIVKRLKLRLNVAG
jgi:putative two-component system response regulator